MSEITKDAPLARASSRSDGRRHVSRAACALLMIAFMVGFGALAAGRAQAAALEAVATCAASGEGAVLEQAVGIAVDDATGDVYIADTSQHRVTRYNAKCEFLEAWGLGVANGAEEFQTCGRAAFEAHEARFPTCEPGGIIRKGEYPGALITPVGIAVDQQTGAVYVADEEGRGGVIKEFSSDGERLLAHFGELTGTRGEVEEGHPERVASAESLAVDAKGVVFLAEGDKSREREAGRVLVFVPKTGADEEYEYQQNFGTGHEPLHVGLDAAGDVFISNETEVSRFAAGSLNSPACTFRQPGAEFGGLAVDSTTGTVFAYADHRSAVIEVDESCAKTGEIPGLAGEKGTEGLAYGPDRSWGPGRPDGVLYGVNTPDGESEGKVVVFAPETVGTPPVVAGLSVSGVSRSEAVLEALVNPEGFATSYYFEYGPEGVDCEMPGACTRTVEQSLPAGTADVPVKIGVDGLTPASGYRFRVWAVSHCEVTAPAEECAPVSGYEAFRTFGPPVVAGLSVSGVTHAGAVLEANVNPEGYATSYYFEYGPQGADCNVAGACVRTAEGVVPAGTVGVPVKVGVAGLTSAPGYELRVLAVSHCNESDPGELCVPVAAPEYVEFATASRTPPTVSELAVSGVTQSQARLEATVDPEGFATTYYFEYGPEGVDCETAGACEKTVEASVPAGEADARVAASVGGLTAAGKYQFRVLARSHCNEAEVAEVCAPVRTPEYLKFGTLGKTPPVVAGLAVASVTQTGALLEAVVDPEHYATTYYVEYGPEGADCDVAGACLRVMEASVPAGTAGVPVVVSVGGLTPRTAYEFRVLAVSHCDESAPEQRCVAANGAEYFRFATRDVASEGLSDGRGYEMVSPPDKHGGEVFATNPFLGDCRQCLPAVNDETFPMLSAPDGNAIVYEGYPFSNEGAVNENEYISRRRPGGGWATRDLSPADERRDSTDRAGYRGFAPDLSEGVLYQGLEPSLSPQAPAEYPDLYLQASAEPSVLRPLITRPPPARGRSEEGRNPDEFSLEFAGASSDYTRVIFQANDALTAQVPRVAPAAPGISQGEAEAGDAHDLYEWSNDGLKLVNVLPGNAEATASAVFGSGRELASDPNVKDPDYSQAISADGSRIFWTDTQDHHVFLRESGARTVYIRDPAGGGFLTASTDGSRVLLSDGHVYDVESEDPATGTPALEANLSRGKPGFLGILGASEDLSRIYFLDDAALADGATNGQPNLYLWEGGAPRFIAVLTDAGKDVAASPSDRTAQVTPDGEYLAFESGAPLTGYDNHVANRVNEGKSCPSSGEPEGHGPACTEVFEYDARTHRLVCASCNPTAAGPLGDSSLSLVGPIQGLWKGTLQQPHNLLADGRLFFDSFDSLSPSDSNAGHEDVYEYEAVGTGSCSASQAMPGQGGLQGQGGCVMLISSGSGDVDSSFIDANPDGSDVFFVTRAQLVPQDGDELIDLYDAREPHSTGEYVGPPAEGEAGASTAGECSSTAQCRPSSLPSALQTQGPPSSMTLSGAGNLASPPPPPAPAAAVKPPAAKSPPTRAQKLVRALKRCHRQKHASARKACETTARKLYGPKTKPKAHKQAHR